MNTIYGECVGPTGHAAVTISRLGAGGCEVRANPAQVPAGPAPLGDGECELWIGAVGPFPIVVARTGRGRFSARFKQPLETAIIAHFAS